MVSKSNNKNKPASDSSYTTHFRGDIKGPVHTGSGDIVIDNLSYGVDQHQLQLLQEQLLSRLNAAEYPVLSVIMKQMQLAQVQELTRLESQIDKALISAEEISGFLQVVGPIIAFAQNRKILPEQGQLTGPSVVEIIDSPGLDIHHRLKLTLPIIPFLLAYEGELDINDKLNLEKAWEWLKSKCSRFTGKEHE